MSVLAAIRADSVNLPLLPLFLHVLEAMLLVGTLATSAGALLMGWRPPTAQPGSLASA